MERASLVRPTISFRRCAPHGVSDRLSELCYAPSISSTLTLTPEAVRCAAYALPARCKRFMSPFIMQIARWLYNQGP